MTKQQVNWAEEHDWYVGMYNDVTPDGYRIIVKNDMASGVLYFTDFNELQNWAGY